MAKGERTLVLNDEVHHVYNQSGQDFKRWKEFLLNPDFGFRYVAGFSGTCYLGNEYFSDVIYRYSLRHGIEQGYCKTIEYVAEDGSTSQEEKFQKIYDNHIQNKLHFYRKVKPLTILVTRDISTCVKLAEDLINFLVQEENIPIELAKEKVLTVTSSRKHQANLIELENVDSPNSKVEWITSVSMLTEGWDVENVFQIVPHEERAFNSKLLIAQVLGRGLRIPDAYKGERPIVTVFNHDSWSGRIKHLVDEVMEIEKRVYSYPVRKSPDYNFYIHQIDYNKNQEIEEFPQTGEYEFSKGYVRLVSQVSSLERETTYTRISSNERRQKKTLIKYQMFTVDQVAEHILSKLKAIDLEEETNYADKYNLSWIKEIIRNSLRKVGEKEDKVSEENRNRIQGAFGVVHRKSSQTVRYRLTPRATSTLKTNERNRNSIGLISLRRGDSTVFLDDDSLVISDEETKLLLNEILDDESLPRSSVEKVGNTFVFKTPLNVVLTERKPERDFVRQLIKDENAVAVDAWIKSTDQEFYEIEYSWRKGDKAKRGLFNPDFFIKVGDNIIIVEIKGDEEIYEPSAENKAKYKAARNHFELLNSQQSELSYYFHFLSPKDYDKFFSFIREKNYGFVSELDVVLGENGVS